MFAPLEGVRHVKVTDYRTKVDWASCMKDLATVHVPHADKITVVMDHVNIHGPASLYEAFAPEEAHALLERFEFHDTPKHGSWLNMVEIELSVLQRQCLDRRIPDQETLRHVVEAWETWRNAHAVQVHWRFTTAEARIKLKRLYPSIKN